MYISYISLCTLACLPAQEMPLHAATLLTAPEPFLSYFLLRAMFLLQSPQVEAVVLFIFSHMPLLRSFFCHVASDPFPFLPLSTPVQRKLMFPLPFISCLAVPTVPSSPSLSPLALTSLALQLCIGYCFIPGTHSTAQSIHGGASPSPQRAPPSLSATLSPGVF